MQYLLQNKVNYLSNTKVIYTNDVSVNSTSNFILYNSDVNTIQRFNYNYDQQANRTSFNVFSVKGASQSEAGSCFTRAYKVNNIIYIIRVPFTCSNYFAIKDEDTLTLTIDVDGTSASTSSYATRKSTSKQYTYPLRKQYVNAINFINIEHICKEITSINITATSTVELTLLKLKGLDYNAVTACSIIFV